MIISNIKIHFRVRGKKLLQYQRSLKKLAQFEKKSNSSFVVVRLKNHYVYVCFFSGFINATGIRRLSGVQRSIKYFRRHLGLKEKDVNEHVIDSIASHWPKTSTSLLSHQRAPTLIEKAFYHDRVKTIKYNRQRFPAVFLKTDHGTILWFPSPAIVAMGSRSHYDLEQVRVIVLELSI
jgi:TATA-box binding protein (TBP) (component of TFIID and TFIIIB)